MNPNRNASKAFLLLGLGLAVALAWECRCDKTVPYNSNSPAAKIREQGLTVPIDPGDDYVRANVSFSAVKVDYFETEGKKKMTCYCLPKRLSDTDRDDKEYDYTLELQFGLAKGGSVYRTLTRSGDFTKKVYLNELCTEDSTVIPERIVVTKIRVTRRSRPKTEVVKPKTQPSES